MASQYPINDDEVDDVLDDEEVAVEEEDADDADSDLAAYNHKKDRLEDFSVAARQRLREELSRQIDAFLARGGRIDEIPSALNSTPPKKPVSDYSDRLM